MSSGFRLDWKLAARSLARRPGAALGVGVSLALGLAVQIVVLSCANAVLWRPPGVPAPHRMVTVYGYSNTLRSLTNIAYPQLERMRDAAVFESVAAFTRFSLVWERERSSEPVNVEMVSENYFDALRPPLELGRAPVESGEVLLGYDLWANRFGRSRDVAGKVLRLSGEQWVVTGVMGREFRGTLLDYIGNPKIWFTLRSQDRLAFLRGVEDLRRNWVYNWFVGAARLREGITAEQAQQAVAALEARTPVPAGSTPRAARLFPAGRLNFHPSARDRVERTFALATGLAALLLVLGCLNTSFFLAGKALAERRQAAMEWALGAGGIRVAARRFLEASMVCGAALAAGSALAAWCVRMLAAYPPPLAAIVFRPVWDWRVWGLTAGWTAVAVLLSGFAPALLAARGASESFRAAYSGTSRAGWRVRETLVAAQVALAAAILLSSGYILRTVVAAHAADAGFEAQGLVMAETDLYSAGATPEQRTAIVRRVLAQLGDLPGVERAAAASLLPLSTYRMPRRVRDRGGASLGAFQNIVSRSYFDTLRLPLVAGRVFAGPNEAVVNQTLASRIGDTLEVLDESGKVTKRLTVVGVARDARYHSLWSAHEPYFYLSAEAEALGNVGIVVRARMPAQAAWEAIRDTVHAVYPRAVVSESRTASSQLASLVKDQTYLAAFFGILAAIALVVAGSGLMANLYLMVSQRTREIGIRQALGATHARILGRVVLRGVAVAVCGLAAGLLLGGRIEGWIRPLAPGTPEGDPWAPVLAAMLLLLAAIAAVAGPAIRAARIDPWTALRYTD